MNTVQLVIQLIIFALISPRSGRHLGFSGGVVVMIDGSWIYNYLCNQCLSPLTLWVLIQLRRGVLDTTLC